MSRTIEQPADITDNNFDDGLPSDTKLGEEESRTLVDSPALSSSIEGDSVDYKNDVGEAVRLLSSLARLDRSNSDLWKEAEARVDSYFVKAKLTQMRKKPLSDYPISSKRTLLYYNRMYLDSSRDFRDKGQVSDDEIEEIFDDYREDNREYFEWCERGELTSQYGDSSLANTYCITPNSLEGATSAYKNKAIREYTFCRVSPRFGVIYRPDLTIDSYFELDPAVEAEGQRETEAFGSITESHLEFFLHRFKNEPESLIYYYQIAKQLPNSITRNMAEEYDIFVDDDLAALPSKDRFDGATVEMRDQLLLPFHGTGAREFLITALAELLESRRAKAAEKQFGFRSEGTNDLPFFLSFIHSHPDHHQGMKHYTIAYYLYSRKNLPSELTEEFENKFNVVIPHNLENIETLDQYLQMDNSEILAPFLQANSPIGEMSRWLGERLQMLKDRIDQTLPKPEKIQEADVLRLEGMKDVVTDDLVVLYHALMELPLRHQIEDEFGINLAALNVREQIQFINFLSAKSYEDVSGIARVLAPDKAEKKGGSDILNRFRSFLSLESDQAMGQVILDIAGNLARPESDQVFAKYGEIVDAAGKVREYLRDQFGEDKSFDETIVEKIIRGLLNKGNRLLVEFSKKEKPDDGELMSDLESYKAEIMLFASTFKALREGGEAPKLEELPGFTIETVDSGELTEAQRIQMVKTFADNWSLFPEVRDKLLASFKHAIETPGKKFYLLKYENDIIGFIRFDELSPDELLAASFIVDKNANGSGMGEAILKNYLAKEAENHLITGYAYPRSPIVHRILVNLVL